MKTRHRIAIVGLFASLGLVAASCVPETTEPEDTDLGPVSEGVEGDVEEPMMSEPDADPEVLNVCRPVGAYCYSDYQCCSGQCFQGQCRYWGGGGGVCRPVGSYCHSDYQCCSGQCYGGFCRHWGW